MAFPLVLKVYDIQDHPTALFEPDRNAVMDSYDKGHIPFPYWSQVWPAAKGLVGFLIQYPDYTLNKRVLELAAGLGLPSIVAASNAASVVAGDYVPEALTAIQKSSEYHNLQNLQVQLLDWRTLPAELSADVLLLSDVSYDATLFAVQEMAIRKFLLQGTLPASAIAGLAYTTG